MATLRLVNVKQRRPRKTAKGKGVKEMMEKLERLGRRLLPHPKEGGEQSKPARGLRWYHRVLLIPALALALVAGGFALPNQAEAHHTGSWYQQNMSNWCYWSYNDYSGSAVQRGCGYSEGGVFFYYPIEWNNCWYYTTANFVDWWGPFKDPICVY
jgi:hypothetical protein